MDRHELVKKKSGSDKVIRPSFDEFGLGITDAKGLSTFNLHRGGIAALAGTAIWKLGDLAHEGLQASSLSEIGRFAICLSMSVLMVTVFGGAAWFLRKSGADAESETSRKRPAKPGNQSGRSRSFGAT